MGAPACIEVLRPSMAFATSVSVDPNRSSITLIACFIAVVIIVMCSAGGLLGLCECVVGSRCQCLLRNGRTGAGPNKIGRFFQRFGMRKVPDGVIVRVRLCALTGRC